MIVFEVQKDFMMLASMWISISEIFLARFLVKALEDLEDKMEDGDEKGKMSMWN